MPPLFAHCLPYAALRSHHLTWRIGPCADRDIDCEDKYRYAFHDFVEEKDMADLHNFIARADAYSSENPDGPEDVAGALKKALSLVWKGDTRIIIHIADAPAHGSEYNGGMGDHYPGPQVPDRMLPPQDSNHGRLSSRTHMLQDPQLIRAPLVCAFCCSVRHAKKAHARVQVSFLLL